MSLIKDLLEHPGDLPITSKYAMMNGVIYLGVGALALIWPGMVQTKKPLIVWISTFTLSFLSPAEAA